MGLPPPNASIKTQWYKMPKSINFAARGIEAEPPSHEVAKVMERIARRERQTLRTRGARKRLPAKRLAQIFNVLIS
jgi:hypothetical protein